MISYLQGPSGKKKKLFKTQKQTIFNKSNKTKLKESVSQDQTNLLFIEKHKKKRMKINR